MPELVETITQIEDHSYKYYDSKEGEKVIVFLHGIAANKEVFRYVAENFLQNYRCIILDLPAHHGVPLTPYNSIHEIGQYVANLINYLQLKNVVLVGFSMGGVISLETGNILRDSGKIRAITAWSSPVLGLIDGATVPALLGVLILKKLPEYVTEYFYKNHYLRTFLTAVGVYLGDAEAKAAMDLSKADRMKILRMLKDWKYEHNDIPKLFIFDPKDPIIDTENYRYLATNGNSSDKVLLVPRGGHFGLEDGWNTCVKEIESFVEKTQSAPITT